MMEWFIFYSDDYADNGGIGWTTFATSAEALEFINERLRCRNNDPACRNTVGSVDEINGDYVLIEGTHQPLKLAKVVTNVQLDRE